MHFEKTYSQLLHSLPPELRANAIEYRQLKKLINRVVEELTSLGLSPEILQEILEESQAPQSPRGQSLVAAFEQQDPFSYAILPRITYELDTTSNELHPQLRLRTNDERIFASLSLNAYTAASSTSDSLLLGSTSSVAHHGIQVTSMGAMTQPKEVVIALPSDTAFVSTLMHAHQTLRDRLATFCNDFYSNLDILAREISETARPMSQTYPAFHPHNIRSSPATVRVRSPGGIFSLLSSKSDLYAWREVLQLYMDAEIFESTHEEDRGERAIIDAEERLAAFMRQLASRGLSTGSRMKMKDSKHAMQLFIELNASILNLYKFQYATTEATRKILKKHAKRTALPFTAALPSTFSAPSNADVTSSGLVAISKQSTSSLARTLVQAIAETVLPIVPAVEDYNCVICMNIAFKPVRLGCGHLFCVRCLVKMQKRGQDNCPMCRAPCVLMADRSNVDWALLNFMKDWFPIESQKKLKDNEAEVAKEQMEEHGFQTGCKVQ